MKKVVRVILILISALVLLSGILYVSGRFYIKSKLSGMHTVEITSSPEALGIRVPSTGNGGSGKAEEAEDPTEGITNILLLGVDTKNPEKNQGSSDCIMVLTLDKRHNKLKLTSIMRDSYVPVEGYGMQKITYAHAKGGPLLTLKTVNRNYGLDIKDYVKVNFFGFEKIIDYLGGVPINVTKEEIPTINWYIRQVSRIEKKKPDIVTSPGLQNLSGIQAMGYSRVRYVGRSDFQRTDRQRTILDTLFKKLSDTNPAKLPEILEIVSPYVETSISTNTILDYGTYVLTHRMTALEQNRIPYDGLWKDKFIKGNEVLIWDKEKNTKRLHEFIYE